MAFVVFVLAVQVICTSAVKERFKPPQLTDEEENSNLLPAKMKCDGCRAAAYHIFNAFEKLSLSNAKKLKEDVVYDAVDMGCDESNFREYGIKLVKGKNMLSGQGLAAGGKTGLLQGGGKNPHRLRMACFALCEDREMDVYTSYVSAMTTMRTKKRRRKFSRDQCVAIKYCTGAEDESRFAMEKTFKVTNSTADEINKKQQELSKDKDKNKKQKKKKNKKKKKKKNKNKNKNKKKKSTQNFEL